MGWKGIFFGALIGFLSTRSFWGAVVGAIIGHLFDQSVGWGYAGGSPRPQPSRTISEEFFRTTFALMGRVAKADGRVSEAEIGAARRLMQELRLGPDEIAVAIGCFRAGKSPDYDADAGVDRLRAACGSRHDLLRAFMEVQLRAVLAGDGLTPPARAILMRVGERLGMSGLEFAHMEASLRARQAYTGQSGPSGGPRAQPRGAAGLAQCYAELDIDAKATNSEVTKAYRRQMSRHHPDKLVANGLPESMAQMAKEKTQRIQEAYENIRAARGMR